VDEKAFFKAIPSLHGKCSDRAILRAFHFIREDARVPEQVAALKEDRIGDFLQMIRDSGRSSYMYLQNIFADEHDQSLGLALCLAGGMLFRDGAWRIHGGGFAGTTLNFVPLQQVPSFVELMERAFGKDSCKVLNIRPAGAARMIL
jgi:galactokinase